MTTLILPKDRSLSKILTNSKVLDQICKSVLVKKLKNLHTGHLILVDKSGPRIENLNFGDQNSSLKATIHIHRSCFYSRTLLGGSIGNGESYVDADWDSHDLTALIRIFVLNRDLLQSIDEGIGSLLQPLQKLIHGIGRANTIHGSRENIRAHYDIGNDFFKLFLDETMMYSSALFSNKDIPLKEASLNKIQVICQRLALKSSDHLIEIGSGWGSLAIYASQNYGCKVTTTTISSEQFQYTKQKVKEAGLEEKVTVLFEDYRKLKGTYDKLVSIEMIEAVGINNLPVYFSKCSSLLKEDGLMVIQAITIRDQFFDTYRRSVDFIQRHIFPGGGLPSVSAILGFVSQKTNLILIDQKDYAEDYAHTLYLWAERLKSKEKEILELGYPDYLHRLWQYYFSYCEGAFRERAIGLSQLTLAKPKYRDRSLL